MESDANKQDRSGLRRVFLDDALEERFQRDGYVIVDFMGPDDVRYLKEQFYETLKSSGELLRSEEVGASDTITYDFTFIDKNTEHKREVFDIIVDRFTSKVDMILDRYKPIIANYIRKEHNDGEVPLHQNWAFVDEERFTSVSVWCPLIDSNRENGTLEVVPGSHKRCGEIRGPMVPWELNGIKEDIIRDHLVPMNIRAGQAVILDDSIVHYSAVNRSDEYRIAIQLIMIPEETESIHYHLDPDKDRRRISVLEVDKEFYMNFNPWKKISGEKVLRVIDYRPYDMSIDAFKGSLYGPRFDLDGHSYIPKRRSILGRLKEVFS